MDYLENLLAKGVTWGTAARILWTLVPQALGLTIPMAVLVGILIGLGRMSADRESVALLACGVSPYRLLRPIGLLAALAALATGYVMIVAIPDANQTFREITFSVVSQRVETDIQPRVFYQDFPGWVLYARDEPDPGQTGLEEADGREHRARPARPTMYFAATRTAGRRPRPSGRSTWSWWTAPAIEPRSRRPGRHRFAWFPRAGPRPEPGQVFPKSASSRASTRRPSPSSAPTARRRSGQALKAPRVIAIQQKFSFPVACLVFGVIGLALGMSVAREGKLAGFVVGTAVIFAYYIVMFLSRVADQGTLPEHVLSSRWVPNIVLGVFGVAALIWRARFVEGRLPFKIPVAITKRRCPGFASGRRPSTAVATAAPATAAQTGEQPAARRTTRPPAACSRDPHSPAQASDARPARSLHQPHLSPDRRACRSWRCSDSSTSPRSSTSRTRFSRARRRPRKSITLLVYMTPQFVYYVIPICGAAERAGDVRAAVAEQRADGDEGLRRQPLPRIARRGAAVAGVQRHHLRPRAAGPGAAPTARPKSSTPRSGAGRRACSTP